MIFKPTLGSGLFAQIRSLLRALYFNKDEEFSATLLFFQDKDKFLLTFKNSNYNYQNESIWLSKQSKEELYQLIVSEMEIKPKYKNIEVKQVDWNSSK